MDPPSPTGETPRRSPTRREATTRGVPYVSLTQWWFHGAMKKKTWITGLGLGAAIVGGSLLLATVSPIGLAGAQDEADTSDDDVASEEGAVGKPGRHGVLDEVLDDLVAEGTIDQADAEAVAEAMDERIQEFRADHPGRRGRGHGPRLGPGGPGIGRGDELPDALGMTHQELRNALADGQTLEEIAEAAGIDLAEVANERLDDGQDRLDEALADGSIDEERAEAAQKRIDEAREAIENGDLPAHGPGHGHRSGRGGPADDADDE